MAKLTWGNSGDRIYEVGVDRGVLYPASGDGVPWNGLVNVTNKASASPLEPAYFDGVMYFNDSQPSDYSGTIQAISHPNEFLKCLGEVPSGFGLFFGLQPKETFGFSYRTLIGNDTNGLDHGYRIHIVYNAKVVSTDTPYQTLTTSPALTPRSFEISARPEKFTNARSTAHVYVDTTRASSVNIGILESLLYGSESTEPKLPTPFELTSIFSL